MNKYMEKKTKLFFPVKFQFVQSLSCVQLFMTPWTAACQASMSFTLSWSLLKLMSIESVMLTNDFILCGPLLLLPSIFPSIREISGLFASGGQSIGASTLLTVLPRYVQDWFLLGLTGLIFLLSQESSAAPQFQNINSSALSLLYGRTLTSIHDHWKNHSLD